LATTDSYAQVEGNAQAAMRNCCYALLVSSIGTSYAHAFYRSLGYNMDDYRGF